MCASSSFCNTELGRHHEGPGKKKNLLLYNRFYALKIFTIFQLVFALAAAVRADPGFVYSTGLHTPAATVPLAYTHHNVVPYLHHTVPYVATPVVTNVCK